MMLNKTKVFGGDVLGTVHIKPCGKREACHFHYQYQRAQELALP